MDLTTLDQPADCHVCDARLGAGQLAAWGRRRPVTCADCARSEHAAEHDLRLGLPEHLATSRLSSTWHLAYTAERRRCCDCDRGLPRGALVRAGPHDVAVKCGDCAALDAACVVGLPGATARDHDRTLRAEHRRQTLQRHPLVGRLLLGMDAPAGRRRPATHGAPQQLASTLGGLAGPGLRVLHDRRLPASTATVDHLVVTTAAVWVVATAHLPQQDVDQVDPDELRCLRWRSDHVEHAVRAWAAATAEPAPPVRPVLCLLAARWPQHPRVRDVDGCAVLWPAALVHHLTGDRTAVGSTLAHGRVGDLAKHLAATLR